MWASKQASRVHLELQYTPPSPAWVTRKAIVGTWLSLVERTLGVGEVASSNLVVPTIYFQLLNSSGCASWVQPWGHKGPISEVCLQTSGEPKIGVDIQIDDCASRTGAVALEHHALHITEQPR
jgi:hypothetical protein